MRKPIYRVTLEYYIGPRKINDFLRNCDLGIDGSYVQEVMTIRTTTKFTKKMESKYITALNKALENKDYEIRDIRVSAVIEI